MATLYETSAISIQRFAYGETSQIVHFLTPDEGRVALLAKGAFRAKNSYDGPIDLLVAGTVRYRMGEGQDLGTLTRRKVSHNFPGVRREAFRYEAACELLGLVLDSAPVGTGGGDFYRLFERGLQAAESLERDRLPLLMLSFQLHWLAMHGLLPNWVECVRCGEPKRRMRFVVADGGVVCESCRGGAAVGESLSAEVQEVLRHLGEQRLADVSAPGPATLSKLRRMLRAHLDHHLERPDRRPRTTAGARWHGRGSS